MLPAIALVAFAACDPIGTGGNPGTIEICKSSANGMAGKSFSFKLDNGTPFTVKGGSCSGPISASAGTHTVTETPASGTEVQDITVSPSANLVNKAGNSVTVSVTQGSTAANETLVTFYNQPTGGVNGYLKVCKASPDTALQGSDFSFTENGGPAFSVTAGPTTAPGCSAVQTFQQGTQVNIAELPTVNTYVSAITVSDNRGSNISTASGTVTATIGSGTTIVTYTNRVNPTPQTGYIEVCKLPGDQFVTGAFTMKITSPIGNFTDTESVQVYQCTGPIKVPAGNVTVTETARFPYQTSLFQADPPDRLVSSNTTNQTATVTVPVSSSTADETRVDVTNVTRTGLVKVCKTLDTNAGALAGKTFNFTVTSATGTSTVGVIAGAAGTTACRLLPGGLPLGSSVSITEQGGGDFQLTGVSVSPSSQDNGSGGSTARLIVGSGTTTAFFTNQAVGNIKVCKEAGDNQTKGTTATFTVNGVTLPPVPANGGCTAILTVPAGTATVSETVPSNFKLASVTASAGRLLTGPTDNPAKVQIFTGGIGNETVVYFTDRVKTGQFEICKQSSEPTLQAVAFPFAWDFTIDGVKYTGTASLTPGECTDPALNTGPFTSGNIPVVDSAGNRVVVNTSEGAVNGVQVSDISVQGSGTLITSNTTTRTASFYIATGNTAVTYTNVRTPAG